MANIVSAVVRFYPVTGKVNAAHFMNLYEKLNKTLWRSYYFFNTIENCIEILYPCKRPVSKDILENEEIIENYHVWIRVSDFSCYEDFIGFKSQTFKPDLNEVDPKCEYWAGFTPDWNYATSCLYQADELQIRFNTAHSEFLDRIIQHDRYNPISREISPELIWRHKMMFAYLKSSQVRFEDDCTGEHIEENFYDNELGWNDVSSISGIIINDNRIRLQEEFLGLLYKYDQNSNTIRCDKTIEEVSFRLHNKPVQIFKWTEKENEWSRSRWIESTKCDWSNCIDPKFMEFKTWFTDRTEQPLS
ncbi:MAG: hypothetical protein R2824_03080 [Saprospiraceae bacterium]